MTGGEGPSLYVIGFELGIYGVAAYVIYDLVRTKRFTQLALMLAAMCFAGALEVSDIRTTHSYYYERFMIMIGSGEPTWFPLAIAVAWGLVLHTVMTVTERLLEASWQRPFVAALLGVLVDLLLDPVVADARLVTRVGEYCDASDLPHGSAYGLGFWVWCVPTDDHTLIWGIPFANFFAWGVVVLVFSGVATVLREAFEIEGDRIPTAIAYAVATGVGTYCIVDVAVQMYPWIILAGVPEWVLLAAMFAPGVWFLLRSGPFRVEDPIRLSMWLFPPASLLYCVGAYLLDGTAVRAGVSFFVYVVAVLLACGIAYAWALLGRFPGLVRARPHVTPPRPELIADAPVKVEQSDLQRIAAMRDPALRNFMITQRYHDLSCELARVIAGPNANWCTFATWASKTAGESIREEEVPKEALAILRAEERVHAFIDRVAEALTDRAHVDLPDVFDVARATLSRVRTEVGDGNRKVFAELAPLFAQLIACFDTAGAIDGAAFDRLIGSLRPGPTEKGGQDLLKQGFSAYREASRERDERKRAQWMLLGNCLVGLHEQTRLQQNIAAAMDAPVDVIATEGLLAKLASLLPPGLRAELNALLAVEGKLTLRLARAVWQRIATAAAMHISLPYGAQIPLGEDVCVSLGESFPADLRAIGLPQLRELIARFGADHEAPGGLGAVDWGSLDDRMRFIIDLFRATQHQTELFEQPFSRGHQLEIAARYEQDGQPVTRVQPESVPPQAAE